MTRDEKGRFVKGKSGNPAGRKPRATVQCLHMVGHGCPDLLVGWHGENILMEVKMTSGDMTPDELKWHAAWQGEVNVVRSIQDALECLR